jgi:hypothetical protein
MLLCLYRYHHPCLEKLQDLELKNRILDPSNSKSLMDAICPSIPSSVGKRGEQGQQTGKGLNIIGVVKMKNAVRTVLIIEEVDPSFIIARTEAYYRSKSTVRGACGKKTFSKTAEPKVIPVFSNRCQILDIFEFSILIRIGYVETSTSLFIQQQPLLTMA